MHNEDEILLPAAYLGPISYYGFLVNCQVCIEACGNYTKQTYANRCRILTAGGILNLIIPVQKTIGKQLIRDVRIDYHTDWQTLHWRALEAAYNTSPFFDYFRDDIHPFYERRYEFLLDFDLNLQNLVLNWLGYETSNICISERYIKTAKNPENDLREWLHPKKKCVLLHNNLKTPYQQVFSDKYGFVADLSIADMLCNLGREARLFLNIN